MEHGGNIEEIARLYNLDERYILDFSANINPTGLSTEVKIKLIETLDNIERYPDIKYFELREAISEYESIDMKNIIPGNGATEIIFNISKGLNPKNALLIAPTFSEYEESLRAVDCNIEYYRLKDDFVLDLGILDMINESVDIIFVCNPNNPTGLLTEKNLLIDIIEKAKKTNTIVVVDESFMDFVENKERYSVISLTNKYDNLIIVKSLTKYFAFPGLRVGYGITNNEYYNQRIKKVSPPWSINTLASKGAVEALRNKFIFGTSIEYLVEEREFIRTELEKFRDIKVFEGKANFLFFMCNNNINLQKALLEESILIRSCSNYINLDKRYYRIAIKTRYHNMRLLEELRNIL